MISVRLKVDKQSLEKIKHKDRLGAKLPYSTEDTDWEAFKTARNEARQSINRARALFVQNNLKNHLDSPKKFWSELKNLMPGKKSKGKVKPIIKLLNDQGQ